MHLLYCARILALKKPFLELLEYFISVFVPLLILLAFCFNVQFHFGLELLSELLDVLGHLIVLGELVADFEFELSFLLVHGGVLKLLELSFESLLLAAKLAEKLAVLLLDLLVFLVQDVSIVGQALVNRAFLL